MPKTLKVRIHVDGVRQTLAAFNRLDKAANDALREHSKNLSELLARRDKTAAHADSPQAAAVAHTVKAVKDRVPAITAGGPSRIASTRVPAYKLIFGSEFGAKNRFGWYNASRYIGSHGRQYRPHLGRGSYWFFHTVEENQAAIGKAWSQAADDIVKDWSKDGGV
jgi:hypothetical protein